MEKALIFGEDTRSFLGVVRSLGRKGIEVHVAPAKFNTPGLRSKYIKRIIATPNFNIAPDKWLLFIEELLIKEEYQLVIPCDDRTFIPFCENRERFKKFPIAIITENAYRAFYNKIHTRDLCANLNIPVANGTLLSTKVTSLMKYPVYIKPSMSYTKQDLIHRGQVEKVNSQKEFKKITAGIDNKEDYLVEESFEGDGVGISVIAENGHILTAFQHRRLREPLRGGGSSYRKSEAISPQMLAACEKLCSETKLNGVAMFEFKVNSKDWILLEVNARFWGSLPLALNCKMDFPYWLFQLINKQSTEFKTTYPSEIYAAELQQDFYCILEHTSAHAKRVGRLSATLYLAKESLRVFGLLQGKEHLDSLSRDDPKPFFADTKSLAKEITTSVIHKLSSILKPALKLIASQKLKKISKKGNPRFAFVCYGNICRSPLAKLALKQIADEKFEIESFGTLAIENRQSPDNAIAAASAFNIDMDSHRSKYLTEEAASEYDAIFYFDRKNRADLDRYQNKPTLLLPLALFNNEKQLEIDDPYGNDIEHFKACYLQILDAIKNINTLTTENMAS